METIDHRHVMTVLQSNTDHEPPYFTMPIASYSLKERLRNEDGGISEDEAIGVFLDICRGVQALHNSGVTHRDIKPGNVMIMNDEIVTVADMGLAKIEPRDTTTLTMTADVLGTHSYMAPEQQKPGGSRDADEKTDVYQLGKTLYEIITGENPIFIDNSTLPSGISYIVDVCTNDIPEKRYKSVGRLMDAIQNYKESKDPDRNPLAAFENALEEVTPSAEEGEYNRESLENIVEALHRFGSDPGTFIEQFDQIKDVVLRALSLKLPDQLREILTIYSDALSQEVGTYQFSYAESVANRMEVIFRTASDPDLKAIALKPALIASVELNRYAAMDTFDGMLTSVRTTEVALAVSDVLEDEVGYYSHVADRVPRSKIDPAIQDVYDAAV